MSGQYPHRRRQRGLWPSHRHRSSININPNLLRTNSRSSRMNGLLYTTSFRLTFINYPQGLPGDPGRTVVFHCPHHSRAFPHVLRIVQLPFGNKHQSQGGYTAPYEARGASTYYSPCRYQDRALPPNGCRPGVWVERREAELGYP